MRVLAAVLLSIFLVGAAGAPAGAAMSASERDGGVWYAEALHLDEIQQSGLSGDGVTIAVIDDGINTEVPELRGADITVKGRWCAEFGAEPDPADTTDLALAEHGTAVTSMIVGTGEAADGAVGTRGFAPEAQVWFYAGAPFADDGSVTCEAQQPEGSTTDLTIPYPVRKQGAIADSGQDPVLTADRGSWDPGAMAALDAIRSGVDIVNVSSVMGGSSSWEAVLAEAVREGVPVVAGTFNPDAEVLTAEGNEATGSRNLAVAAPGADLLLSNSDADWSPVIGSGTSFATPIVASIIALGMQNDPEASAHQVLQAMIRSTGSRGVGEPEWSDKQYGYGVVNPREMLEVDATQFPDENPLFVTDPSDPRCSDPITGANPGSVSQCMTWAYSPVPEDVWPSAEAASGDDTPRNGDGGGGENGTKGGDGANADPAGLTAPPAPEPPRNNVNRLLLVGGGLLVATTVVVAMIAAKSGRRARGQRTSLD